MTQQHSAVALIRDKLACKLPAHESGAHTAHLRLQISQVITKSTHSSSTSSSNVGQQQKHVEATARHDPMEVEVDSGVTGTAAHSLAVGALAKEVRCTAACDHRLCHEMVSLQPSGTSNTCDVESSASIHRLQKPQSLHLCAHMAFATRATLAGRTACSKPW
jgi:hypothetical protein